MPEGIDHRSLRLSHHFSFRRTKETMQSNMTGRYRYYKGNTILGVACHSEALEEIVVYRAEYGECEM